MTLDPILPLGAVLIGGLLLAAGLAPAARLGVTRPYLAGVGLRAAASAAVYLRLGLWAPDALLYDRLGVRLSDPVYGYADRGVQITSGKEGFPRLLGLVYSAFGHHPGLGLMMNVMLGALLVPLLTAVAARLDGPRRATAWLAAVLPPFLVWGGLLLREALSWVLIAVVVLALAGISRHRRDRLSRWDWPLLIGALAAFLAVRGTAAILLAAAALAVVALTARQRFWAWVLGTASLVLAAPALAGTFDRVAGGYDLERINTVRGALSDEAGSSFAVAAINGPADIVRVLPTTALRGFLGPYPWEWPRLSALATLEGLLWLVMLALAVHGWRTRRFSRSLLCLALPTVAIVVPLALASGNYGTFERLREQATVVLVPAAAIGLAQLRDRRRRRTAAPVAPARQPEHAA